MRYLFCFKTIFLSIRIISSFFSSVVTIIFAWEFTLPVSVGEESGNGEGTNSADATSLVLSIQVENLIWTTYTGKKMMLRWSYAAGGLDIQFSPLSRSPGLPKCAKSDHLAWHLLEVGPTNGGSWWVALTPMKSLHLGSVTVDTWLERSGFNQSCCYLQSN